METKKISVLPFFLTVFIDQLGWGIVIPVLAPIFLDIKNGLLPSTSTFGFRTITLGLLMGSYSFAQFLGAPILGGLSDRFGRRKILLISLIGTLIGYAVFAIGILNLNLYLLFISRLLSGFTGGNISTILSAIADISDKETKVKNFGLIGTAYGLGLILGPFIGGKLGVSSSVSWFNYATPFWFAFTLVFINILIVYWRFPETLKTKIQTKISVFSGFRNIRKALLLPNLRTMFIVMFLLSFVFAYFVQFFQVYVIHQFKFDQAKIGNLFAYIALWAAFAQGILARILAKKYSPSKLLVFSILFLALTFPFLLIFTKSIMLYFILPFIVIASSITLPNATAVISDLSTSESQGEILGINQSVQSLSQAIPPVLAGYTVAIDPSYPIVISFFITLFTWFIFFIFFKHQEGTLFIEE